MVGASVSSRGPSFTTRNFVGVDVSKSFVDITDYRRPHGARRK
jgi:hypothetical protein